MVPLVSVFEKQVIAFPARAARSEAHERRPRLGSSVHGNPFTVELVVRTKERSDKVFTIVLCTMLKELTCTANTRA